MLKRKRKKKSNDVTEINPTWWSVKGVPGGPLLGNPFPALQQHFLDCGNARAVEYPQELACYLPDTHHTLGAGILRWEPTFEHLIPPLFLGANWVGYEKKKKKLQQKITQ